MDTKVAVRGWMRMGALGMGGLSGAVSRGETGPDTLGQTGVAKLPGTTVIMSYFGERTFG
jgi:hypothetical protein